MSTNRQWRDELYCPGINYAEFGLHDCWILKETKTGLQWDYFCNRIECRVCNGPIAIERMSGEVARIERVKGLQELKAG